MGRLLAAIRRLLGHEPLVDSFVQPTTVWETLSVEEKREAISDCLPAGIAEAIERGESVTFELGDDER